MGISLMADALDTIGISTTGISSAINDDTTVTLVGRSVGISTLDLMPLLVLLVLLLRNLMDSVRTRKLEYADLLQTFIMGDFLVDEV